MRERSVLVYTGRGRRRLGLYEHTADQQEHDVLGVPSDRITIYHQAISPTRGQWEVEEQARKTVIHQGRAISHRGRLATRARLVTRPARGRQDGGLGARLGAEMVNTPHLSFLLSGPGGPHARFLHPLWETGVEREVDPDHAFRGR
jgi:hypothetical protein